MHDKYNEIKQFIENKYTGTEKEDILNSLDSDFQEIMLKDIVEPTEIRVDYVKSMLSLIEFFRRSDVKRGKKVKTGPEEIRAVINHLDSQSKILEEARKKLKDANRKNGAFKYVQELFETLGINMKQISMETKKLFVKAEKSEDEKEKQIFELSNKRSRILHDNKHYLTDEEKYREVAKKSKKVTAIDQSIEKLINDK